jgi:plasmid stabilization system protein ParE
VKVRITAQAESDLESIADCIAKDNPARALSFLHELRDACLDLGDIPLAFQMVPRYERFGVRRRVHGNYLIFYRVEREQVVILHVLHGAMDLASVLFDF